MLDNRKLLVAITALAIAGTLGLLAYSTSLGAIELDIGDIQRSHEGSVIVTTGTVIRASTFSGGSISLGLGDMATGATVGVYIPPDAAGEISNTSMLPGTVLRVRGELSYYLESPEISVARAGDISTVAGPGETEYGLDTVMAAISLFDGLEATTSGRITDMNVISPSGNLVGTSFRLREVVDNRTYYLECMCYGRDLSATHSEWDCVKVTGTISYYRNLGCWQMDVEIVTHVTE